jgi:spore maturation protein SpmB
MVIDADTLSANVKRILDAFGVREAEKRACSFAFSSRPVPASWKAFAFGLQWEFYYVLAPNGNITQIRSLTLGISRENFALLAVCDGQVRARALSSALSLFIMVATILAVLLRNPLE